ncbi:hypothetical protein SAMN05421751_11022 [Jhaorihella thermophila]|uniref:Fenitrothion hydrolase n=2 Tax=Jhaorihella thermophila TaxID=488547 RepID=A0A1H5X7Y0_9RHOB|nr:hypothetical protein SAMN05421751_11022 [Jhaorihella thermophila]
MGLSTWRCADLRLVRASRLGIIGAMTCSLRLILASLALAASTGAAHAHASEGGLVLLLPTDLYVGAGAGAVALTVLLLTVLPDRVTLGLFRPLAGPRLPRLPGRVVVSCLSFLVLVALVGIGAVGPTDPQKNLLPLSVWTLFWVGLVTLQGLFGNLWAWVNPWTGPVAVTREITGARAALRLSPRLGHAVAIATWLGFAAFLLVDPAPADPRRLAAVVWGYWVFTFAATLAFGPRWLRRAEAFTVFLGIYARVAILGRRGGRLRAGVPGWRIFAARAPLPGLSVLMVMMLATGSFDGLNETFWWFSVLGLNPLEFPGRSAVVLPNLAGLLVANAGLVAAFALTVWAGLRLARSEMGPGDGFRLFAPTLLPIALGYHVAHYLTSFMVDGQYALLAATDPLGRGDDLLGLGKVYVTTGFFNTLGSMRVIWLSMAGAVVLGHVIAVLLAHAVAVRALGPGRRAALSQAPLAIFMIFYTLFGLWLLASPRGL